MFFDTCFGPSAFIDFIHTLQLDMTGADISFAAPLSFDATIQKGDVKKCTLSPKPLNQWKLIPEKWTKPASERDYQYLFGKNESTPE